MEAPNFPQLPPRPPQVKAKRSPAVLLAAILLVGLVAGGLISYSLSYSALNGRISDLQKQLQNLPQSPTYVSYPNTTYFIAGNVSLASLYQQVSPSVVVIQDLVPQYFFGFLSGYIQQQGSGFITTVNDQAVIVTNDHVMQGASNMTVTFASGDSYPAMEIGSDPLADLAVLTISPMPSGLRPLTIISSSTLHVGDPAIAVGSPYGLAGTLTTGVISALRRTIIEASDSQSTGPTIADVIQTSTPINPGNSGGPLLNYEGDVIGITTADVSNSQGLGFAIPSDTILREISSLITTGSYDRHPSLDATGTDMNYQIAEAMGTNVTYGWLVEGVSVQNGLQAGTRQVSIQGATVTIGGDIIIGINNAGIRNTDDLLSYLEEQALPGQTVSFTVVRNNQVQTISVTIGKLSS